MTAIECTDHQTNTKSAKVSHAVKRPFLSSLSAGISHWRILLSFLPMCSESEAANRAEAIANGQNAKKN